MKHVQGIVHGLGGIEYVARCLGITRQAIERWIDKDAIPISRQAEILHLATIHEYPLTVRDLMKQGHEAERADAPRFSKPIVDVSNPPF